MYVSVWMNFFWLIHNFNKYLKKDYVKASQDTEVMSTQALPSDKLYGLFLRNDS
ncbi:hypothetical protein C0J52_14630 [Blattella germanica]|nr:hypothetical protein C0J52_14630 [Blattella germanica]